MLPLAAVCGLVGLTGCSGVSPIPTHPPGRAPAHRREPRASRAERVDGSCAPVRCRRFAVSGSLPIPNTTSDPDSDQAQGDPSGQSCERAELRRAVGEGNDVADGAALLGAPDGAKLMRHFLGGSGTPVSFGAVSHVAKLVATDAAFRRTSRAVEAELKRQLSPLMASHRRDLPAHLSLGRDLLRAVRPDFDSLARDPDLYLSFRGTQGLSVRGAGRVVRPVQPDRTGHASGRLTYTISDVYGYDSEQQFRLFGHPVGPDLHYLQTICGAPTHPDGAHWFADAVTVTTRFSFPLS